MNLRTNFKSILGNYTAFFVVLFLQLPLVATASQYTSDIIVGAAQPERYLSDLKGKRVGLVVNHTSIVNGQHLVDFLLEQKVNVSAIFSPEHGFRGNHDAGAKVESGVDQQTGLRIHSIYGKNKKPTKEMLANVDVLIFDIQDVGVRFYTYISTMHYVMEAAAEFDKSVIVLDRPNPNGRFVDGPVLEPEFRSFVGMHPIPVLHGLTVAELALMINAEGWLDNGVQAELKVVPVKNYHKQMHYSLPIKPSPNLPNDQSVALYPSLCFFEATPVSIGRGTDFPFQVIGHNKLTLGDFRFTPRAVPGAAMTPKLKDKVLSGVDLRQADIQGLDLSWFLTVASAFQERGDIFFSRPEFMDKLAGTDQLRIQILQGVSEEQIRQSWQNQLRQYQTQRKPYLLYPE